MSAVTDGERERLAIAMCSPEPDRPPVTALQLAMVAAEVERIVTDRLTEARRQIERRRLARRHRWLRRHRWPAEAEKFWSTGMWDAQVVLTRLIRSRES